MPMQLEFWLKVARFFSLEKLTSKQTKPEGFFIEWIIFWASYNSIISCRSADQESALINQHLFEERCTTGVP